MQDEENDIAVPKDPSNINFDLICKIAILYLLGLEGLSMGII